MTDTEYQPPDNCCESWCSIDASEVRILYWPIETKTPNVTSSRVTTVQAPSGVVSEGMSFTSPSVYVAYTNIGANRWCGEFGTVTIGDKYNTTIGYAPDALSTSKGATPDEAAAQRMPNRYTAINYTDFQAYSLKWKPVFSLPSDLSNIDLAWANCFPAAYGAFDPPRTLGTASAMVPQFESSPAAAPAVKADPATVAATATSNAIPSDPNNAQAQPAPLDIQGSPTVGIDPNISTPNEDPGTGKSEIPAIGQGDPGRHGQASPRPPDREASNDSPSDDIMPNGEVGPGKIIPPNEDPPESSQASTGPSLTGGRPIMEGPSNDVIIGTSTHAAGNQDKFPDVLVSISDEQIFLNGHPYVVSTPAAVVFNPNAGQPIQIDPKGGIVATVATIPPGGSATVGSHSIVAGSSHAVIDGNTVALGPAITPTASIAGSPVQLSPNGAFIFAGTTIPSGSVATFGGHVISAGAEYAVVDATRIILEPTSRPNAIAFANGFIASAGGDAITISGTTYSILASNSGMLVNGQTKPLPNAVPQSVFTVGGQTFTANPTGFAIGSQNVELDGAAITVAGTPVSLGPSGLQIASQTIPLTPSQGADSGELGNIILSGISDGLGSGGENASAPLPFTGIGTQVKVKIWKGSLAAFCVVSGILTT